MLDVWDMSDDEFIVFEVDALGNPIGSEGKTLLSAIGSLSKFQFVPELSEQTKRILKDNMSNKWRQFKHDLKSKAYDASKTEEEMVANILDKRVDPSQYRDLVHHWCSKKGQDISNMNKRSCSKYEDLHYMGTKNIPRLIHEKKKENGVQPSRDELKKHMVEVESLGGSQTALDYTNWKNDIYSKVKGLEKRGHVRCLGKLPLAKSSNTVAQSSTAELRIQKLEKVLGNLVSFLQARFSRVQEINDIIEVVDQEIPDVASNRNDYNNSI
ncbi:uncharacterized protein LOC109793774 [Cajanus cajan]|uniref:uncharacterized protein LOC109793774 n=1 Tax=Cajanus cajan TaxID=3821 RepID=UPI0010FADA16|nr:uncharacterized protein LOC109793774 [Cajanus cajan]